MDIKWASIGIVIGFLLAGCAGWSYRYYGLEGVDYSRGTLLSDKPENDLKFEKCAPSTSSKNPCVVLFAPEFFKMKQDYEDIKQRLVTCEQQGRAGS